MFLKKPAVLFWAILVFFLVKGIYFCFFIPPWEAPDETGHVKYVLYLFHYKNVPAFASQSSIKNGDGTITWRYQRNTVFPKIQKGVTNFHVNLFNRNEYQLVRGVLNITIYPPLYYLYLVPFYFISLPFSSYMSLMFLRFGSLLLGMASLLLIYKTAKLLFSGSVYIPLLAMLLIALQPMFTFITAVVNNDTVVIMLFCLFIYLSLRLMLLKKYPTCIKIILVGLIAGLATLSKPQLFVTIPLYFMLLFFKNPKGIYNWILVCMSVLIFPALWYIPQFLHGGTASFSYAISRIHHSTPLWSYPIDFIKAKQPVGIFMSFWGYFGWLDVPMPKWIYALFASLLCIAFLGWIIGIKKKRIHTSSAIALFLISSVVFYSLVIFLYDLLYFTHNSVFAIQGRYFLPLLFLLVLWILQGLKFYSKKLQNIFIAICIMVFIISQITMYFSLSSYYYHTFTFISPLTEIYLQ
ncbi:MAG TPA: DUF2142 domain-containing protein [Patescibacteria group bacterium]|nr:DUF2142 domain-containing protein [Patescibacteria group bacterium]